jgi:prepilin-type N-terminal cleavage/methylation domain-containing protein
MIGCQRNGFTLIEVMAALLLSSILLVGLAGFMGPFATQQKELMLKLAKMNIMVNIRRTLTDDSALMNSIFNKDNHVFDCLRASTVDPLATTAPTVSGCNGQTGELTKLVTSSGQQIADLSDPTSGFTSSGEACTTYGTDPACNTRVKIAVKFVCDQSGTGQCLQPQIVFTGTMEVRNEDGSITTIANAFEIHKDWGALSTRLVELGASSSTTASTIGKVFKLVIIVDNSTSMSAYQARLSSSLQPLLQALKSNSFDLAVQIYSSSQYVMAAASNYSYPRPINSTQQILNLKSVGCTNGTTTVTGKYCEDVPMSGTQLEDYELKPPVEVTLAANASAADYTVFETTILDTVKNMGVAGSDDEQSLCTMSRLLTNQNNFIQTGDKVGFIIISNENDNSKTETCATSIGRKYVPGGNLLYADQMHCDNRTNVPAITDNAVYVLKAQSGTAGYQLEYTCQQYRDGAFVPYDPADPSSYRHDMVWANDIVNLTNDPVTKAFEILGVDISKTCSASGIGFTGSSPGLFMDDSVTFQTGSCPASVAANIEKNLDTCGFKQADGTIMPGKVVKCSMMCSDQLNYGRVQLSSSNTPKWPLQVDNFNINFCASPFDLTTTVVDPFTGLPTQSQKMAVGAQWSNAAALMSTQGKTMWSPVGPGLSTNCCRVPEYHQPRPTGIGDTYKSIFENFGLVGQPIDDAIVSRATALMGKDGFFISSIINPSDPATACAPQANESVGTLFESLAGKVQNSKVLPICSADYADALSPLQNFFTTQAVNITGNDVINLEQGEQIVQIYVKSAAGTQQFSMAGDNGVWPTLVSKNADGSKSYKLDFSKTGYTLLSTDRVWAEVATQTGSFTIDSLGTQILGFDDIRSLYRLGLGH